MPRPPRIMTCRHCEDEFDRMSSIKRRVGGYIDECPDCVQELGTEKAVRYRGVITGDGKQAHRSSSSLKTMHRNIASDTTTTAVGRTTIPSASTT